MKKITIPLLATALLTVVGTCSPALQTEAAVHCPYNAGRIPIVINSSDPTDCIRDSDLSGCIRYFDSSNSGRGQLPTQEQLQKQAQDYLQDILSEYWGVKVSTPESETPSTEPTEVIQTPTPSEADVTPAPSPDKVPTQAPDCTPAPDTLTAQLPKYTPPQDTPAARLPGCSPDSECETACPEIALPSSEQKTKPVTQVATQQSENKQNCTDRTFTVNTYNGRTLTIQIKGNRCTVIDNCKQEIGRPSVGNSAPHNQTEPIEQTGPSGQPDRTNTPDRSDENTADQNPAPENAKSSETPSYAEQVVTLVNEERAKAGLSTLTVDSSLQAAADVRAREIETSFSHTRPDGTSFSTAIKAQGISYRTAGENIAYGQRSPEEVVNAWMNSEGHRANILNAGYTKIGVGYYQNSRGVNYWSQEFTN